MISALSSLPLSGVPAMCFAVFTADGLDQIVETSTLATREKRDLIKMGCDGVTSKQFADESAVYDYCERKGISC